MVRTAEAESDATRDTLPRRLLARAEDNPNGVFLREKDYGICSRDLQH